MPHRRGAKKQEKDRVARVEEDGYEARPSNVLRCCQCGGFYSVDQNHYWQSTSPRHSGNLALSRITPKGKDVYYEERPYVPYCKRCLFENFNVEDMKQVMDLLSLIDIPYKADLWKSMMKENNAKTPEGAVGKYKTSVMLAYKNERFSDSDDFNLNEDIREDFTDPKNTKISKRKLKELEDKWGFGYTHEEYLNFERKYEKMSPGYTEKTALHTERFLDYIVKKVKEEMAVAEGNVSDAAKYETMAKNAAQAAKINVSQLSKSDITGGVDLLPQLVEAVEEKLSLIPIMPKLKAVPYDDVDMNIYALVNYYRRLEDKPPIQYKDVWSFYDKFMYEHFSDQGYSDEDIEKLKLERNAVFNDLGERYTEPLYKEHHIVSDEEE